MKYMVINETDLSNEVVGRMVDQILREGKEDTIYYGKIDLYRFVHGNKGYRLQIRYLKRYVEWRFMENESIHKRG